MNEAQTRLDYIDPALAAAGWGVVSGSRILVEHPITAGRLIGQGRRKRPLKADYVLVYRNKRLAVVEAKAKGEHYSDGVGQAKDYAARLNIRYGYSTNGEAIYGVDMGPDMEGHSEGDVDRYPTPDELWEMTFPTPTEAYKVEMAEWKRRFESVPFALFRGRYLPRYFQHVAIEKVLDAIANKQTRLLLTMATGTGKTATAFHICWKLFEARWNLKRDGKRTPRILFLADRNLLADQAFNSFGEFEEDALVRITPTDIKKKGKVPTNGSVFFTIFQSFMAGDRSEVEAEHVEERFGGLPVAAEPRAEYGTKQEAKVEKGLKGEPYFGEYPPDFFDFIIIDECHRGGAHDESSWRAILEHFSPAVQLGLTATPKRKTNADTYAYFGDPIYTYKLKDGINDGFLTPFKVKQIDTTMDEYEFLNSDLVTKGEIEPGRVYSESDFNRIIEIEEREAYRVKLFLRGMNQNHKTLVFCATQRHAAVIRNVINQHCESTNPDYCHRVTADDGAIGEGHLRDFQDNEKTIPTVLTTSQKLSTGVDAPEIRNIVLMRPVKSMVEFKQIVGRGTRLFEGKDYFTVYDFVEAHKHFRDPEWDGEPEAPAPSEEGEGDGDGEGEKPVSELPEPEPCLECGAFVCSCEGESGGKVAMIVVQLSKTRALEIDSMVKTTFWSPDGTMLSAEEFIQQLFGDLPEFFETEEDLRKVWSLPGTRKKLLEELSDRGYSGEHLEDLRRLVHGEDSDLFDVLNLVAYQKELVPRLERAAHAKIQLADYNPQQQAFLNFVLAQYVKEGVTELDDAKLGDLLRLNYGAIDDAKTELGAVEDIRDTFIGFQEHLYQADVS